MKKYLAIGLAGLTAVGLAACGTTKTTTKTVVAKPPATTTTTAQTTTFTAPQANPQAKAACAKVMADTQVTNPNNPAGWFGQLAEDMLPLSTSVSGAQQTTVFKAIGDIKTMLQAAANGDASAFNSPALQTDAKGVATICGSILAS
jgi:hypothetical protein